MESFEEGMRLFHARQFQQAREFFLQRPCAGRTAPWPTARDCMRACASSAWNLPALVLNTPEEHYNYAITLINSRDLAAAQKHLRAALDAEPTADHVLYALAACQSLAGDLQRGL